MVGGITFLFCHPNFAEDGSNLSIHQEASQIAGAPFNLLMISCQISGESRITSYPTPPDESNREKAEVSTVQSSLSHLSRPTYSLSDPPIFISVDPAGSVYFVGYKSPQQIHKMDKDGNVSLIAGNGKMGFSGDGGPANEAELNNPGGMVFDATGNLYFVDYNNARVRKVDTKGIITTIAGSGEKSHGGDLGDGGPALQAKFLDPFDVAFDSKGNLYIADQGLNQVRRVDRNGIITTVAGRPGPVGFSGDGGPAKEAQFTVSGMALDSVGNLYISDAVNNRIRKVDRNGIVSTIAILEAISLSSDAAGNLYTIDHHRIRKMDTNGTIGTIAGKKDEPGFEGDGGPAKEAKFNAPHWVTLDKEGSLLLRIREWAIRRISCDKK